MPMKTYVGYDLGDGDTITDILNVDPGKSAANVEFRDMSMPDTFYSGQAMPTVFSFDDEIGDVIFSQSITVDPESVKNIVAYFKRRPSDLLDIVGDVSSELEEIRDLTEWSDNYFQRLGCGEEMLRFKNSVTTFTNAIFSDENYLRRLRSALGDSEEIEFCVGHPTDWSELDVELYKLILKGSVLGAEEFEGKKASMRMEAESRAAFMYSRWNTAFSVFPSDKSILLIDVGSSTIDITVMKLSSQNHQYNTGNNYLGARSIDFMIRDWYLEKIKQQPVMWEMYQSMVNKNPTVSNALTLSCRRAKEQIYSFTKRRSVIGFGLFPGIELTQDELERIIDETPVSRILKENLGLSAYEAEIIGNRSWKELFRDFLIGKKEEMEDQGIELGGIILTGGASRMSFVPQTVKEIFDGIPEENVIYDMDPSRSISKGLALAGLSRDRAEVFDADVRHLIDEKLDKIIGDNIPTLGSEMGKVISDILTPKMKKHVLSWRDGEIDTLENMNKRIKEDCREEKLAGILFNDRRYIQVVESWLKNKVGMDIALELKEICDKYGVRNIKIDDLNIMNMPSIDIGDIPIDPLEFMDTLSAVIAVIAGIVSATSVVSIMAVTVVVLSIISETLATSLFLLLAGMGLPGWTVIAAIIGISVAKLVSGGVRKFKELFRERVMGWNLLKPLRKMVSIAKIDESFQKADLPGQIEKAFENEELKNDIVEKISENLREQIERRAEEIKYAIRIN
ncbi:MAG: hypothetical protein IJY04_08045 [Clostridia bacterium]|nr:hypothetical protein [Clostridia bacterium]